MDNNFRYSRKKVLILLIAAIIILAALSPVSGLEITVMQNAVVKGDTICLGDIAQFDPASDGRVSKLKGVEISTSPASGSEIIIRKDLMIYKVNPYISGDKDILVRMPENLVVRRSAQFISAGRMEEIYMGYIKENSGWPEDEIRFEDINTPGTIALPEGELQWAVQERRNTDFIGNVALTIDFSVDGKIVKKVPVSGKIGVRRETVKAAAKIERGRIISVDDIILVNENSLHNRKDYIVSKEDIVGKRALRTIQADQAILSNMIENPPLVKKGDKVIIRAENPHLTITAAGEALQDGRTGDQVEVLNIQSGRKIFATVKESGIVEVLF
jgi:flagella basal body P-ring formation protein FlgA